MIKTIKVQNQESREMDVFFLGSGGILRSVCIYGTGDVRTNPCFVKVENDTKKVQIEIEGSVFKAGSVTNTWYGIKELNVPLAVGDKVAALCSEAIFAIEV